MTDDLLYEVTGGIGRITFSRPEARNALTFEMYDRLAEICAGLERGGAVKTLVLSGAGGRAFAAGTDMNQFRAFETAGDAIAYEGRIERVLSAVEATPVPTIAAITGACTGGGAGIAAACDIRVATPSLKFGFPIARTLGNCLSAANLARLSALAGPGRVKEMIFTARLLGAEDALACGLVTEVADDALARAEEIATLVSAHAPLTIAATKEAMRRLGAATAVDDHDLITLCYMSADFREGLEAFLGKRPPVWKGR